MADNKKKKRIAILTSGGDCSGLNAIIFGAIRCCEQRGYELIGIINGTDGFITGEHIILNRESFPYSSINIAGSFLGSVLYKTLKSKGDLSWDGDRSSPVYPRLVEGIKKMGLDAVLFVGGNGSISWVENAPEIFTGVQVVFIPKTIDMDMPLTRNTVGFSTAISQLSLFIDGVAQSARSHRRWFVVEAMGRDSGHLALRGGMSGGADAIILPEIDVKMEDLVKFVIDSGREFGIVVVGEGSNLKSGDVAKAIEAAGIPTRKFSADYFQRGGITIAQDRLLAMRFAAAALDAVDNGETNVMVRVDDVGHMATIGAQEFQESGIIAPDPNIPDRTVTYDVVHEDDQYLKAARELGIFLG
ncbi:MAG: 6-phosphofructokinase [Rickettsiales bacterium]|nr:6-phosphofructokinase [Rickettsiales bacterium]